MHTNLEHLEPRLFLSGDPLTAPKIVDNGDAAFGTSGSWSNVSGSGYQNDLARASGTGNTATWTFNDLTPGYKYRVSTTWAPNSTLASNAQFTVVTHLNDEVARTVGSETLDQRVAPNDFTSSGVAWEEIGDGFLVRGDSLSVTLRGSSDAAVVADAVRIERVGEWVAPIGTPTPDFGINESHWMYADSAMKYDFGQGLEPYRMGANGPYTHYVNSGASNATDTNNPFGTPEKPRKTIPTSLAAGSVVEIAGSTYTTGTREISITGNGTAAKPIFVRGADRTDRPAILEKRVNLGGQYMVFEDVEVRHERIRTVNSPKHISVRHVYQHGWRPGGGGTGTLMIGSNLVLYNSEIANNHSLDPDKDVHSTMSTGSYNWLVDNEMYGSSGDSFQVNSDAAGAHHIYVSRNTMHHERENAVDIKGSRHIVISENTMYGFRTASTSDGTAIVGGHEGSELSWYLYNEIFDSNNGIRINEPEYNLTAYAIGNVIHDMSGSAIVAWFTNDIHVVNNVMYNVGNGFVDGSYGTHQPTYRLHNNIISNVKDSHIIVKNSAAPRSTMSNNLLYQPGGNVKVRWGNNTYSSVSSMISGTGKGQGSLEADPHLVNPATEDFRLRSGSPAIDAGMSLKSYNDTFKSLYGLNLNLDADGNLRQQGVAVDMGAYEYGASSPGGTPGGTTNVAPVAASQSLTTDQDKALSGTVSASDANGDSLTYSVATQPSNGTLTLSANGSFTYTPAAGWSGADSFSFRASDGELSSNAATVSITVNKVVTPNPATAVAGTDWTQQDIGAIGALGGTTYVPTSDTFTVNGSGADIGGSADAFQFAWRTMNGDGEIVARVTGVENTYRWAKAGLMVRDGLTAEAKNVLMAVTPEMGSTFQYRGTVAGGTTYVDPLDGVAAPQWLKLVRQGSTFTGYRSDDGVAWTQIGSASVAMNAEVQVGLAVSSLNDGTVCTASFTDVQAPGWAANQAPVAANDTATTEAGKPVVVRVLDNDSDPDGGTLAISSFTQPAHGTVVNNGDGTLTYTPATGYVGSDAFGYTITDGQGGSASASVALTVTAVTEPQDPVVTDWTGLDVGTVGAAGSMTYDEVTGIYTVDGSGADIGGSTDAFQFVHRSLTGDGQIVARVLDVENTYAWAKAGVMVRDGLGADAKNVLMAITPEMGSTFQHRGTVAGGTTYVDPLDGIAAPHWVKLVRKGSTFTGYRSADGVNWMQIGSTTVEMGSTVEVGLAVSSLNDDTVCTARFASVSLNDGQRLVGDANLDGVVNDLDLSVLLSHWGQADVAWGQGDFSGDGRITDSDLSLLLSHWGDRLEALQTLSEPVLASPAPEFQSESALEAQPLLAGETEPAQLTPIAQVDLLSEVSPVAPALANIPLQAPAWGVRRR